MIGKLLQPEAIFFSKCIKGFGDLAHSAPVDPVARFMGAASLRGREGREGKTGERERGDYPPTTNSWIRHW